MAECDPPAGSCRWRMRFIQLMMAPELRHAASHRRGELEQHRLRSAAGADAAADLTLAPEAAGGSARCIPSWRGELDQSRLEFPDGLAPLAVDALEVRHAASPFWRGGAFGNDSADVACAAPTIKGPKMANLDNFAGRDEDYLASIANVAEAAIAADGLTDLVTIHPSPVER